MKLKPVSLAVAVVAAGLALSTTATAGVVKTKGEDIILSTKNGGLQLKTESGDFSFKISGKLQWDYSRANDLLVAIDKTQDKENKGFIRRAEIAFSGTPYKNWKYKLKLKDGDDKVELDDAKITYKGLKPLEVTVGRWGRDYGLENTTSSSWIMGIERPMLFDVLEGDSGNDYGVEVATGGDNYTAAFGIHHDGESDADNGDEQRLASYVFRGTFVPVMEDDMLVHLGFNYYNRNPDEKSDQSIKTRFGVKQADKTTLQTIPKVKSDSEFVLETVHDLCFPS